jgi:riboflavin-specific deaminase-like protein
MVDRPRVFLNFAVSADGKIAPSPALRPAGPFSMSADREDHRRMRELRAEADAILIGAGNLRADDPDLAVAPDERQRRRAAGQREPLRLVVTHRGDGLSAKQKMFDPARGGASFVLHGGELAQGRREDLARVATLVPWSESSVDILGTLAWLVREQHVRNLLCEGGGVLAGQLFRARAVDQLFLTVVPRVLGGSDAPTLTAGPGLPFELAPHVSLGSMERVGDELFLRYDFQW